MKFCSTACPTRRGLLQLGGGLLLTGGKVSRLIGDEPGRPAKDLIFRTTDPRNAEPSLDKLVASWITPNQHFYVRSHAPNPVIDPDEFRLTVEGLVRTPTTFTLDELKSMPRDTVTATLTCAGNRRAEFNKESQVGGVQWTAGAIGNATWSGVSLAAILKRCEVRESARHVWFEGLDEIKQDSGVIPFGGSIPIAQAMLGGGAMLAYQMNGEALPADHGYPLRTIVPGYIGARSVKWLGKIVVSDRPSPNHYLQSAYKLVKGTDDLDWSESGPIYRFPINGAIATPPADAAVDGATVEVTGYALPSGRPGSRIKNVFVSADRGRNWMSAELTGTDADFCWQLWKATLPITSDTKTLLMRAEDSAGDFMPGRVPWNAKGYLQNSWYRTPIKVRAIDR